MPASQIPALNNYTPGTAIVDTDIESDFAAIRDQFNALVTADGTLDVPAGESTDSYHPGGVANAQFADAQTTQTATIETVESYTVPADALNQNGRALRLTMAVTTAANTNTKQVEVQFGNQALEVAITTVSGETMLFECLLVRTGTTTARTITKVLSNQASVLSGTNYRPLTGLDYTVANNLSAVCRTPTATTDLTITLFLVEYVG